MAWRNHGQPAAFTCNVALTVPVIGWVTRGAVDNTHGPTRKRTLARPMSYSLERMVWMPSPPLAPGCGPDEPAIDLEHLGRMTMGDPALEREVLAMFAAQASSLADRLIGIPPDAATLAHTLKGSARAIGATRVAEAAEQMEDALRTGASTTAPVAALRSAITEIRGIIDAILRRS